MEEIYLRKAAIEDLPFLYEFEQGIIEFERPFDETLKPNKINYYDLKEMILATKTEVIVAVWGKEIVASGYIDIRKAEPYLKHTHYGYLGFMFVKPAYRGKGINKLIIKEMKTWARSKNIYELRLNVYDENDSAVKAYEKAGFKKQMVNMRMEIEKDV